MLETVPFEIPCHMAKLLCVGGFSWVTAVLMARTVLGVRAGWGRVLLTISGRPRTAGACWAHRRMMRPTPALLTIKPSSLHRFTIAEWL